MILQLSQISYCSSYYKLHSLDTEALFYTPLIFRTPWLSHMSGLQVWFCKSIIFDLQGHYRTIWRHWFGVKRAYHYSVVWQSSLPKGTVITSLSAFQLTPGKGIIGNHPCNAVPLSFWQLSETTALWFCLLDVKSELKTPSVPQAQRAVSWMCLLTSFQSTIRQKRPFVYSRHGNVDHISWKMLLKSYMRNKINKLSNSNGRVPLCPIKHVYCNTQNNNNLHLQKRHYYLKRPSLLLNPFTFFILQMLCPCGLAVFVLPFNKDSLTSRDKAFYQLLQC